MNTFENIVSSTVNKITARKNTLDKESGNAFLMYMLILPVLVFTMGFGMQVSINQYIKTTLQSSMESATQSALSQSQNGTSANNNVSIAAGIKEEIRRIYDINRWDKLGQLICFNSIPASSGSAVGETITPRSGCKYKEIISKPTVKSGQLFYSVQIVEHSKNIFGVVFENSTQTYNIIADARITRSSG